jgi:hypothetical protein
MIDDWGLRCQLQSLLYSSSSFPATKADAKIDHFALKSETGRVSRQAGFGDWSTSHIPVENNPIKRL